MIRNKSDIIIIGSGLIGLITAFCLAKLGFSITIIEKETISNFNNSAFIENKNSFHSCSHVYFYFVFYFVFRSGKI